MSRLSGYKNALRDGAALLTSHCKFARFGKGLETINGLQSVEDFLPSPSELECEFISKNVACSREGRAYRIIMSSFDKNCARSAQRKRNMPARRTRTFDDVAVDDQAGPSSGALQRLAEVAEAEAVADQGICSLLKMSLAREKYSNWLFICASSSMRLMLRW